MADRGATPRRPCSPHGPTALRGPGLPHRATWCATCRARRRCPTCPRATAGCSSSWPATSSAEVADARPAGRRRRRRARLAASSRTRAEAAALWRIREDGAGLAGRTPAGRPAHAGWEDAAVPPERLGAYLREFEALLGRARPARACRTGTSATAACTSGIDFPFDEPGGAGRVPRPFLLDARAAGGRLRRLAVRRARRRPGPQRAAAAACTPPPALGAVRPGQARASTRTTCSTPASWSTRAPLDADLRPPAARGRCAATLALAYRARRRRLHRGGAPLHRGRQVPRRPHRHRRGDVPVVPGHPRGEGLHPRPGPGAAGDGATARSVTAAGARRRCTRRSTSACPARAARRTARPGSTWPSYKAEVLHQTYRRRLRPRSHYTLGWLPRWARLAARAPRLVNRGHRRPGRAAALAKWARGVDQRRRAARLRRRTTFRQWFAARPARDGRAAAADAGACCGWTPSPTTSRPRSAIAAVEVLEARRLPGAGARRSRSAAG